MDDNSVQSVQMPTGINQIPDISPIDVQPMSITDRLQRLEIATGITINPS